MGRRASLASSATTNCSVLLVLEYSSQQSLYLLQVKNYCQTFPLTIREIRYPVDPLEPKSHTLSLMKNTFAGVVSSSKRYVFVAGDYLKTWLIRELCSQSLCVLIYFFLPLTHQQVHFCTQKAFLSISKFCSPSYAKKCVANKEEVEYTSFNMFSRY